MVVVGATVVGAALVGVAVTPSGFGAPGLDEQPEKAATTQVAAAPTIQLPRLLRLGLVVPPFLRGKHQRIPDLSKRRRVGEIEFLYLIDGQAIEDRR